MTRPGPTASAPAPATPAPAWPLGMIVRLAAATTLIVMAFAMAAPVLAVSLKEAGHSTAAVGAFAMIPFAVIGVLIPLMPRVLDHFGMVRAYRYGCVLQLAGAVGYAWGDGFLVWAASALVSGIGAAALWNATEALLAQEAPPQRRGHVMGLYQTALGAALALGPFAPSLLGWGARPVLWLAAALVAVCCAMAWRIAHHDAVRHADLPPAGTWQALRTVPVLAGIALAGGVFEAGLSSVSAAHASGLGLQLSTAVSVAGAIGMGSFLCQYPAGMAADRFAPAAVFGTAAMLLLAASAAFALTPQAPWLLWAAGGIWGGVGGALYTLSMIRVAHVFRGQSTAGGTAAMITGYTAGGALGPLASGAALQWGGVMGLAGMLGALAIATLAASRRLGRAGA